MTAFLDSANSLLILSLFAVVLFCFSSRQLLKAIVRRPSQPSIYALAAQRLSKAYGIFSWSLLSGFFLLALVISLSEVYSTL